MNRLYSSRSLDLNLVIRILSLAMILYHLVYTQTLLLGPIEHQNMHLLFALLIVFFDSLKKNKNLWPLVTLFIFLSLLCTGYIFYFFNELENRMGIPTPIDIIIGLLLVVVCLEACRQALGNVLPVIALCFIAYTFLGQYLPGPFWHFPMSLSTIVAKYNIGFSGMFGMALGISADYIFLFMVFGAFLQASGGSRFFSEVGKLAGKRLTGGPGMTAVVSSALVGSLSGSGMANVAITGPFTIPLMKKVGYTPAQAGGIETVASTGGLLVPPIMGVVAFVMAEYMGVPYIQVCAMSIVPAIIYYFCLGLFVQFNASKMKLYPEAAEIDHKALLRAVPLFFVPIAAIVALLLKGYSLRMVSFVIVILILLLSSMRKETRGSFGTWIRASVEGATIGAQIAVACALVGVVLASFDLTGIGLKFPAIVGELSGNRLPVALLLVGLATLMLGCGIPPFAAYLIVAMLCVPALLRMGVPLFQAHFFVFLLSAFGQITPPIAITAITAAPIAGAGYLETSIEGVKAGLVAWLLPFLVIYSPVIILQPSDPFDAVAKLFAIFGGILLLQAALVGYYFTRLNLTDRSLSGASAVALIAFVFQTNYLLFALGLVIGAFSTLWQLKKKAAIEKS